MTVILGPDGYEPWLQSNGIRIRIPCVRTGKAPRFRREQEAGAWFRGGSVRQAAARRIHLLPGRMDLR